MAHPRLGVPVTTRVGLAVLVVLPLGGCHEDAAPDKPQHQAPPVSAAVQSGPARLPEDPRAGRRSTEQWAEHLEEEERERQMLFDYQRRDAHRAVVALIQAARARYDRAQTEGRVAAEREQMGRRIAEIDRKVSELDRHRNSSALLGDYDALLKSLAGDYAEACILAQRGDDRPLRVARTTFDRHLEHIDEWLAETKEIEEEMNLSKRDTDRGSREPARR